MAPKPCLRLNDRSKTVEKEKCQKQLNDDAKIEGGTVHLNFQIVSGRVAKGTGHKEESANGQMMRRAQKESPGPTHNAKEHRI